MRRAREGEERSLPPTPSEGKGVKLKIRQIDQIYKSIRTSVNR